MTSGGMPDWNNRSNYTTGTQVATDGFIVFYAIVVTGMHVFIAVNDKQNYVLSFGNGENTNVRQATIVPVNAGDRVYVAYGSDAPSEQSVWKDGVTDGYTEGGTSASWAFFPKKQP